jgi:hypothetical protein
MHLPRRRVAALAALTVVAALAALALTAGFRTGFQRSTPPGEAARMHAGTIASQLFNQHTLDYTATYQLASGTRVTLTNVHRPDRFAADGHDWKMIVTRERLTECRRLDGAWRCHHRQAGGEPTWQFGQETPELGIMLAEDAARMLFQAGREQATAVSRRFTEIVGRQATCIRADSGEAPYEACATEDGLLGSFTGTIDGREIRTTLVAYDPIAYASALEVPKDAVFIS